MVMVEPERGRPPSVPARAGLGERVDLCRYALSSYTLSIYFLRFFGPKLWSTRRGRTLDQQHTSLPTSRLRAPSFCIHAWANARAKETLHESGCTYLSVPNHGVQDSYLVAPPSEGRWITRCVPSPDCPTLRQLLQKSHWQRQRPQAAGCPTSPCFCLSPPEH